MQTRVRPLHWALDAAILLTGLCFSATSAIAQTSPAPEAAAAANTGDPAADSILNLDLEQLASTPVVVPSMDIPVTSVTKEESTVGRSAAAVFVITNEMIRRSGATSVPEALRMAPGLDVAQVNSSTWAISCRGFNSTLANKLLVLIDGRTVYTPVFSGVYWDVQDVLLEDVERIEVIRGPGGTLWGANAVNGVINIITKRAADTQGAYVHAMKGDVIHSNEAARYGGQIGDDWKYRVYGKYQDNGQFWDPVSDTPGKDAWNQGRVGFRADWNLEPGEPDSFTIQGEHYVGNDGSSGLFTFPSPPFYAVVYGSTYNTGQHILARYQHIIDDDSDWSLQAYYDNFQRDTVINDERVKTTDVELQYRFLLSDNHQITCGAGYRYIHDNLPSNTLYFRSIPTDRSYYIANQFIQDEITLVPDTVQMIVGCKIEQNSFTFFECQPTIRALYTPDRKHTLWGAVSRAVHTPSRVDENSYIEQFYGPPTSAFLTIGNPAEKSETLMAYELGYRTQATDDFSWDLALFSNDYYDLRSIDFVGNFPPPPYPTALYQLGNEGNAHTYGAELAANYNISDTWKVSGQYTYLQMHIYGNNLYGDGYSPRNQIYLRSTWNLTEDIDFDLMGRYVDSLSSGALMVPSYIEMDARLAWRARKNLELAVVGQNLLQAYHYEFLQYDSYFSQTNQVPRSVYGMVTWRY